MTVAALDAGQPSTLAAPRRRLADRRIKAPKATTAGLCRALEQLPNIGPSLAADLRSLGIVEPAGLVGRDAHALYLQLCALSGQRQDPCVLDTFMAAVDFMSGAPARPWWHYTAQRKAVFGDLRGARPASVV